MADGRILVVEDDVALAELVQETLQRDGYQVTLHHRGDTAVGAIRKLDPDLLLLDLMLPGTDGFDILRQLRPAWSGPVLMLTARGDAFDQVSGLELGADDYVVKPVLPRVLLARVKALLRRAAPVVDDHAPLDVGGLHLVPSAREVRAGDQPVPLTDAEYDLLWFLARNAGRVVEREELFQELRGIDYDGLDRSMDLRVSKLRATLRKTLGREGPIRTVHGRGYLFAVDA
ncbi:MAG: response regulator transcription factor [Myxococcota bacterium]